MSQRPVSYAGKRIAPSRRSAPLRKAPSRPAPYLATGSTFGSSCSWEL